MNNSQSRISVKIKETSTNSFDNIEAFFPIQELLFGWIFKWKKKTKKKPLIQRVNLDNVEKKGNVYQQKSNVSGWKLIIACSNQR